MGSAGSSIQRLTNKVFNLRGAFSDAARAARSIPRVGSNIPGFANGVQNFSGGLAMVGERGPEMVQLPKGSNVIPNQTTNNFNATFNSPMQSAGLMQDFNLMQSVARVQ